MANSLKCIALLGMLGFTTAAHSYSPKNECPQAFRVEDLKNIIENSVSIAELSPYHMYNVDAKNHYKIKWDNRDWFLETPSIYMEKLKTGLKDKKLKIGSHLDDSSIRIRFNNAKRKKDVIEHEVLHCTYTITNTNTHSFDPWGKFWLSTELSPTTPATGGK